MSSGRDDADRRQVIGALAELFDLLGEIFLEPGSDAGGRIAGLARRCPADCAGLRGLPAALADMDGAREAREPLSVAYAGLFLHGDGRATVHLYESVHTQARLMAPECLDDLKALHDAADVRPRGGPGVSPDHLGMELEFLSFLLANLGEAGTPDEQRRWTTLARTLLQRHLAPFGRLVAGRLEGAEAHPYYRAAARALVEGLHACAILLEDGGPSAGAAARP